VVSGFVVSGFVVCVLGFVVCGFLARVNKNKRLGRIEVEA